MADGKARGRYKNRLFILPQLDRELYVALQALRARHGDASQWEIVSAALKAFTQLVPEAREAWLADFRGKAPSDQDRVEVK